MLRGRAMSEILSDPPPPASGPYRISAESPPVKLPKSVTNFGLNSIAVVVVLGAIYVLRHKDVLPAWLPIRDPVMFLCGAAAIPILFFDVLVLKVHRRETTGIDWDKPFTPSFERLATKLLGFAATLAPFALAYWAFPEYQGSFYDPFYGLFKHFWIGLLFGTIFYFTLVDGHMREPQDSYWQVGRVLLGKGTGGRHFEIANHYRGWLVKAFFFPLMFVWLNNSTHNVVNFNLSNASWANLRAYDFLYDFIFFIDLLFTTVGYALCFRPIDTHIRTAEPTMLGWCVALFCYEPFFSGLFEQKYVKYGGPGFGSWLSDHPELRWTWAIAILALITIYVLATIAFGVRFSNLTHRGILTNGPYRFTKHPAYVSKKWDPLESTCRHASLSIL